MILAHGSLALMISHPTVNLGPRSYHNITERVDNTVVSSNLAPSEFNPLYASCDEPGVGVSPNSQSILIEFGFVS